MARPESITDVSEFLREGPVLADFSLADFAQLPAAVEAYAAFVRATAKIADVTTAHGRATVRRPKTDKELAELLADQQRSWDTTSARYAAVREAVGTGDPQAFVALAADGKAWKDYESYTLRRHAEAEGLAVFGLIDAKDATRAAARELFGLGDV